MFLVFNTLQGSLYRYLQFYFIIYKKLKIMLTYCLLILLLCVFIFHVTLHYSKRGKLINKIPGPTPLPILGNMLLFHCSPEKAFNTLHSIAKKYYPICRLWFTTSAVVLIQHPDDLKTLLTCKINIEKSNLAYENYKFCIKGGIFLDGGEKWNQRRKLINNAFHTQILKNYLTIANNHAKKFIETLSSFEVESSINIAPMLMQLTLAIICEAAMGINFDEIGGDTEVKYRKAFDVVNEVSFYRIFRPYLRNWMLTFLPFGWSQDNALDIARTFMNQIIGTRQNHLDTHGYQPFQDFIDDNIDVQDDDDDKVNVRRKKLILLDLLLTAKKEGLIDDKGIMEEVQTFVAAGYETVAITLTFVFACLAENVEAQDRVRAEIYNITQKNDNLITPANVMRCDYLDRCIKESLRLFPSGPVIGRCLDKDIQLKNYTIPAKTEVALMFYDLHRNPEFWPEPEKFDPDRFLPEQIKNRHPFAYLPFSAGPRNCIGQKFAMNEMKLIVARVISNYQIEPVESMQNLRFEFNVILKTTKPIFLKFIKIPR